MKAVWAWVQTRLSGRDRRGLALLALFVVAGVLVYGSRVHAIDFADTGAAADWILTVLGEVMTWIIQVLLKLVLIIVNILIWVAQYNDFVHAQPVEIGWVLVRDVVNMFFIVILLISAFSTIISYPEDFHYKRVLPKLLVMAILINFSKTLVGVMIDFSQVVMLTFVNAFKEAATGNFINALKLTQLTTLNADKFGTGETGELAGLFGAALLAILMLGATLTLMVIMTLFLIVRIVGLWMILIFSPIAFFALALPSKIQSKVSPFTSDWWGRLSTFLIAGPVMAFFLWLTLAVVQGSSEPFGDTLGGVDKSEELNSVTKDAHFITTFGKASNIATYLVAFVMMLSGVEFAVKSAGNASSGLGRIAALAAAGGGVAAHAARGAARIGRFGAATARRAGGAAFEGVDRVADVRGFVGQQGLKVAQRLPGAAGAETFAKLATHRKRDVQKRRERFGDITKNLTAEQKLSLLEQQSGSRLSSRNAAAAQMEVAKISASRGGFKHLKAQKLAELEESHADMDENERLVLAEALTNQEVAERIQSGRKAAGEVGDDKVAEDLDKEVEKNTSLQVDWAKLGSIAGTQTEDYKGYLKDKKADAFKDSGAFLAHGRALGFVGEDGSIDRSSEAFKYLQKHGGSRWAVIQEHVDEFEANQGAASAQIAAMKTEADTAAKEAALNARSYVSAGKDGDMQAVKLSRAKGPTRPPGQQAAIQAQLTAVQALQGQGVGVAEPQMVEARRNVLRAGGNITQAFAYNQRNGQFQTPEERQSFAQAMSGLSQGLANAAPEALEEVKNLDLKTLTHRNDGNNDARTAALKSMDVAALHSGYQQAAENEDGEAQKKIVRITGMLRRESRRVVDRAKTAKVTPEQIQQVAQEPNTDESLAIQRKMQNAGIANPVEAAQIVQKAKQLVDNEDYHVLVPVGSRAADAAQLAQEEQNQGGDQNNDA